MGTKQMAGRRTLAFGGAVALFLVAAFSSGPLLRWATREVGGAPAGVSIQAWFANPAKVGAGVERGTSLQVTVRSSRSRTVPYTATDGLTKVASGAVEVSPSRDGSMVIPTSGARPHTWIVVRVSGLAMPLRAWLK
jgi:hypothetical protein